MPISPCPWCLDPEADEDTGDLCRPHQAEYEGTTEADLDRRDAAEIYDRS